MAEATEESPLEEIKEAVNEVVELLNQPNLPIIVKDGENAEPGEPATPKE